MPDERERERAAQIAAQLAGGSVERPMTVKLTVEEAAQPESTAAAPPGIVVVRGAGAATPGELATVKARAVERDDSELEAKRARLRATIEAARARAEAVRTARSSPAAPSPAAAEVVIDAAPDPESPVGSTGVEPSPMRPPRTRR